jgi:hypothetical protein
MYARVGAYYYFFPTYAQAKKVIWDGMTRDGFKFTDHIPKEIRKRTDNGEMLIETQNGSIFRLVGTDNINAVMGSNPVGCVFSEWSLQNPQAWDFVRPILAENGGWAVFIYTPRGRNHGYTMLETAKAYPDTWYSEVLSADATGAISATVLEQERLEITRKDGTDALFQQEYMCSFDVPIQGAYYAVQLMLADAENRVTSVRVSSLNSPIMGTLAGFAIAAVIWYSSGQISSGEISTGDLVAFIGALLMASRPLKAMGGISNNIMLALVSAERYFSMIENHAHVVDSPNANNLILSNAEISIKNLSFSYDKEKPALKDINLQLKDIYAKIGNRLNNDVTNNINLLSQYGRLDKLKAIIEDKFKELNPQLYNEVKSSITATFQQGYYTTNYINESLTQLNFSLPLLNANQIKAVVLNPMDAIKWNDRLTANLTNTMRTTQSTITQGILQNKGYQETARNLKKQLDISYNKAIRIVRTESHRSQIDGRNQSIESILPKAKRLVTTLGAKARILWSGQFLPLLRTTLLKMVFLRLKQGKMATNNLNPLPVKGVFILI